MQPQQPYQSPMQPVLKSHRSKLQTIIFILLVSSGVLLILSVAAWIFLATKQSSDTGKTQAGAARILESEEVAPVETVIASDLGMKVVYNSRELAGFALHGTVTYSGGDLGEQRPYSVIRVRPIETSQAARSDAAPSSPELRITSSLDSNYWQQFEEDSKYKDLSKIDQLVQQTSEQRKTNKNVVVSEAAVQKVGDTEYRKVSFTEKNEEFGVTTTVRDDCYISVVNDRPYVACVNNIRANNFAAVPQLEQVVAALRYTEPEVSALVSEEAEVAEANEIMLDAKDDEDVSERSVAESADRVASRPDESVASDEKDISGYLKDSGDLRTFAKAAPATVRVGVIYCADIQLKQFDGRPGPMLTGACVNRGGSGFFISSEGLISVAASTVDVQPQDAIRSYIVDAPSTDKMYDRLDRVLNFLVESRSLMESDAEAIRAGVQERDQDIVDKVGALSQVISPENITVSRETYQYATQLSDKPIAISTKGDGEMEFAYSDQVIEGELVAKKWSPSMTSEQIQKGEFLEHDTALLRVKKEGVYPTLRLATSSTVGSKAVISFMGLPSYAVGTLETGQMRSTPLLRQGIVKETLNGVGAQRLLSVEAVSHAGLIGSPALDKGTHVIGVATYANANCPNNKCFGGTILRDLVDTRALLKERNITLNPTSPVSETWNRAIDTMLKGDFTTAHTLFERSAALYPANYLATPYANYAKAQIGSARDTSVYNMWLKVAQFTAIGAGIALLLLVIIRLAFRLFTRPQPQTQYGQLAGNNYIDPAQWQQGGTIPQPKSWNDTPPSQQNYPTRPAQGVQHQQPYNPQYPPQSSDNRPPEPPVY